MHYALTIWTVHFSLKNLDCKKFPNPGHLPYLALTRTQTQNPILTQYTFWSYLNLNPCSICRNCCLVIFLILKLPIYWESIKPHSKQCSSTGLTGIQYVVVFRGHDHLEWGFESAPNSRSNFWEIAYFWNSNIGYLSKIGFFSKIAFFQK